MPLKFPGAWRFNPPPDARFTNHTMPHDAVEECLVLIQRVANQGDRQEALEHFKGYFCGAAGTAHSWSSNVDWADTDLRHFAHEAARNCPLFIEAFYDACAAFPGEDPDLWAPDVDTINALLAKHRIGYRVRPPRLALEGGEVTAGVIPVPDAPPTLAQRAVEILHTSLSRSEDLLVQGRGREAVQESLWLLETVATAFRGVETKAGTVEGKYFSDIVKDLRRTNQGTTLHQVLSWVTTLHGYLSSPTGGGVRHGLDLNEGVDVGTAEARLYCNLVRSYLSFLLLEHERLVGGN